MSIYKSKRENCSTEKVSSNFRDTSSSVLSFSLSISRTRNFGGSFEYGILMARRHMTWMCRISVRNWPQVFLFLNNPEHVEQGNQIQHEALIQFPRLQFRYETNFPGTSATWIPDSQMSLSFRPISVPSAFGLGYASMLDSQRWTDIWAFFGFSGFFFVKQYLGVDQ
ncbi:hypothetical protein RhiirA1_449716 [Rhizophagus irregularis]|uniref:Uncharacterized protein n=1 Tax=Rhizophagus irregularis TaxID=588596 RepID=A0A2N0SGG2_9GLOM|nr:hypothetical protein RhiirA1_449716 [Rhizophagus irregularis]